MLEGPVRRATGVLDHTLETLKDRAAHALGQVDVSEPSRAVANDEFASGADDRRRDFGLVAGPAVSEGGVGVGHADGRDGR